MIPLPKEIHYLDGKLLLPKSCKLKTKDELKELQSYLKKFSDCFSEMAKQSPNPLKKGELPINLNVMPRIAAFHKDMHLLQIGEDEIIISAKSANGFRYGLTTLLQIFALAFRKGEDSIQTMRIIDYPAYDYRGLHLDVSRHFFGLETVKRYLDYMSGLKLNYLHWHLSDDQGWRIESRLFPKLNEISSYRIEPDGSSYGGYYTWEEIKEVVDYAKDLGIEVVPEIDLPGHTLAILAAYPHFACDPIMFKVANSWGIFDDILCAGKEEVFEFLEKLLGEVAALFPCKYFHIGGDEAPKTRWQACPLCNSRLKELGLSDYEALQGWFTNRLVKLLKAMGKEVIAWDEVLDSPVDTEIIAMAWRGDAKDSAKLAAKNGNRYILVPNHICYLDWRAKEDAKGAHGVSTLENVYSLEPRNYAGQELCLGLQANLWTEHIFDEEALFKMLNPRAKALAERAWNPKADYQSFLERLKEMEG